MPLAAAAIAALISSCAPRVSPDTMNAIISVESGGNPLAIGDNTTHRAYAPRDVGHAQAIARTLLAKGHSLDLGIAQINNVNFAAYHVTSDQLFDPCTNLNISADILSRDYAVAARVAPNPQAALWGAISAYNTGSLYAGAPYVSAVVNAAVHSHLVPTISLLTGEVASPQPSGSPNASLPNMSPGMPTPGVSARPAPRMAPRPTAAELARRKERMAANAPLVVGRRSAQGGTHNGGHIDDGIPHTLDSAIHGGF